MPDYLGVNPSDGIEIFNGAALVDGRPVDDLRVWMPLANDLGLHWTTSEHLANTGRVQLSFEHGLFGAITVEGTTHDTTGFGTILHESLGESSSAVDAVEMHWVNLPQIGVTRSDQGHELAFSFDGWHIELAQRPDLVDAERMARRQGARILVTHSATLSRTDGEHFQMEDSLEPLASFHVAVSFGLGRFVAPLLPVGLSGGTPRWQAIRAWRVDGRFGQEGVAFPLDGSDFAELVARVGTALLDPVSGASVRYLAMHAVVAHRSALEVEARLMTAQAGVEFATWLKLITETGLSRNEVNGLNAAERMRIVLDDAGINREIPEELEGLLEKATRPDSEPDQLDGPGCAVWARNQIGHPKDPRTPYEIDGLLLHAGLLMREYLELLVLHRVGYQGSWCRQYPPGRWAGEREPVPWAPPPSRGGGDDA